jgi:hypothetical protein
MTDDQRQTLGEALSKWFGDIDFEEDENEEGQRMNRSRGLINIFDYCDSRNIDDLIDRIILPNVGATRDSAAERPLAERLIAAIEGECAGLAITSEQASSILAYLQYGAAMDARAHGEFVFPPMPRSVVTHDKLGPMFDRLAMQFYADKCMQLAARPVQTGDRLTEDQLREMYARAKAMTEGAWIDMMGRALLAASTASDKQEAVLDKPAQVSATRFGKGVKWATVIGAAQRYYEFMQTPEKEALRIENARAFIEGLAAPLATPSDKQEAVSTDTVSRAARILRLVDEYEHWRTKETRDALRHALYDELRACPPAQSAEQDRIDALFGRVTDWVNANGIPFEAQNELFRILSDGVKND